MLETVVETANAVRWALVIYSWVHIVAFVLSWVHADPNNQIVHWINRVTMPLWNWVRSKSPKPLSPLAPYLALMLILFMEIFLPGAIRSLGGIFIDQVSVNGGFLNLILYFILGGLVVAKNIIWFVFLISIVWFFLSFVNPSLNNPIVQTLMWFIDPLITSLQRILPRAKVDLSPLLLAVLCFAATRLIGFILLPVQSKLII